MKKFLIINPFGIGDVLFTTPVIRALKNSAPDVFVGYWCNERTAPILENNPNVDKIFALSRGDIKRISRKSKFQGIARFLGLLYNIKKERFNISLDFSLDHRYSLISKLSGIKRRVGFDYKKRGRFLTDKISIDGYQDKHIVEYYLSILGLIDIKAQGNYLELAVSAQDEKRANELFSEAGIREGDVAVGVAPGAGASWGREASAKHWPLEKFAQLADKIITASGAKILILGDKQEEPIAAKMINSMSNKPIDLCGKTNLRGLCAVIKNLRLLITNDGGPLHIASALGVKTVSIFGPVDDKVYGPYSPGPGHIVLKKDLSCRPCYQKFRMPECEYDRKCLSSIGVEEVFDAVRRQL